MENRVFEPEPTAEEASRDAPSYRFAGFHAEPRQRRLRAPDGDEIELTPRHFDVLLALLERPRTLLRRDELITRVWGDIAVTDASLTQAVSTLRRALGTQRSLIVTVPKSGYRFEADVEIERPSEPDAPEPDAPDTMMA